MVSVQSKRLGKGFTYTHVHTLLHFPEIEIDLTH